VRNHDPAIVAECPIWIIILEVWRRGRDLGRKRTPKVPDRTIVLIVGKKVRVYQSADNRIEVPQALTERAVENGTEHSSLCVERSASQTTLLEQIVYPPITAVQAGQLSPRTYPFAQTCPLGPLKVEFQLAELVHRQL